MLRVTRFEPSARIRLGAAGPALTAGMSAEVERLWQAEQSRRGTGLFNGRILSAVEVDPDSILGEVVEYRLLIAQIGRPELFHDLKIRPVAVSGMLECPAGLLFGRRAGSVTQDAGSWELCPSGGLDVSRVAVGADVDYRAQLMVELAEEAGLTAEAVTKVSPFCLVEDTESHVIDVGISLRSPLSAEEMTARHRGCASGEYAEIAVVARADLADFLARQGGNVARASADLIEFAGLA